jgi:hypothetical protein
MNIKGKKEKITLISILYTFEPICKKIEMRRAFTIITFVLLITIAGYCQFPLMNGDSLVLVENSLKKINKNISFAIIPGPVYGATEKLGFVVLPMLVYNLDKNDHLSPPSSSAVLLYFDFYGSWQVAAKQSFYWNHNKWRAFITAGLGKMQMRFFGIGRDSVIINNDKSNYDWISTNQTAFHASCYRKVVSGFYAGLEYNYSGTKIKSEDSTGAAKLAKANIPESEIIQESVLVPTFVWDNRNNIYWSTRGYYAALNLQFSNHIFLSSANYSIVEGFVNGYHQPLRDHKRFSLAWHFYMQLGWGDIPYPRYSIFGTGDDATGYTHGKYVNNSEVTSQVELRYDIWKFIGVGGYVGTGKTFPTFATFGQSVWLHFGGIRGYVNIIPSRNIRLRVDLAIARKDFGFYFGIGQGF